MKKKRGCHYVVVDVDKDPEGLSDRYSVTSIPVLMLLKTDKLVARVEGVDREGIDKLFSLMHSELPETDEATVSISGST